MKKYKKLMDEAVADETKKRGLTSGGAAGFGGPGGKNQKREIHDTEQNIPDVTRNLPHIRQPEERDEAIKDGGSFTSFVKRQQYPRFWRYL